MKDLATFEAAAASANLGPALMTEAACLRHTDIPHTSRLFSDFQYHFDRVARFYGRHAGDPAAYLETAKELTYPADRRAELVKVLRARNGDSPSLDVLARPDAVAV